MIKIAIMVSMVMTNNKGTFNTEGSPWHCNVEIIVFKKDLYVNQDHWHMLNTQIHEIGMVSHDIATGKGLN